MPSERKFYRSVIKVTVLSEEPVTFDDLPNVHEYITNGDGVGTVEDESMNEEIDAKACADALYEVGSEPGFFRLTDEGEDDDDEILEGDQDSGSEEDVANPG